MIDSAENGAPIVFQEEFEGLEPERTLVFEIVGSTADCAAAIQKIPGLSVAFEAETDYPVDDDFSAPRQAEDAQLVGGRLYAIIPDLAALRHIVSLWGIHQRGEVFPSGMAVWKQLFAHLRAVRPWGPEDRLLPETREYLAHRIAEAPDDPIRVEVQLWYRDQPAQRNQNIESLTDSGGRRLEVVAQCVIEPIQYHAALVDLMPTEAAALLQSAGAGLGSAVGVMHLRPQSMVDVVTPDAQGPELEQRPEPVEVGDTARLALLDGMPLQRHEALNGRIRLDDPDGFEASCPPDKRSHGTAMSSLILNGDLRAPVPLGMTLYVRPILSYDAATGIERSPRDSFPLDLVFRAVRRMKEGEAGTAPSAPSVVLVNLSVGDAAQPFSGRAGPWARLIDYLAFRYRLLFVVSAGNHRDPVLLPEVASLTEFESLADDEREALIVKATFNARATRTLLAPAESANALTIGACHHDNTPLGPSRQGMQHRPFRAANLPNVSSAFGPGVRRSVKPDMVFDGGREYVRASPFGGGVWVSPSSQAGGLFGHLTAAPDATGALNRTTSSHGTSNAAALVSHNLAQIIEVLDPLRGDASIPVPEDFLGLATKVLAVHACRWGEEATALMDHVGPAGSHLHQRRRMNAASAIGFGRPDFSAVRECARNRAVMIDWGTLEQDRSLVYRMPIPDELDGTTAVRRAKVTIAWLSPINGRRAQHRSARFEISAEDGDGWWIGKDSTLSPPPYAEKNGTCVQLCLEARNVVHFADMRGLGVRITCRPQHGSLSVAVPFAVAMTFELADTSSIDVYNYVRLALLERVRAGEVRART